MDLWSVIKTPENKLLVKIGLQGVMPVFEMLFFSEESQQQGIKIGTLVGRKSGLVVSWPENGRIFE